MASNLYKCVILINTDNTIGVDASAEATNQTDFENTHKSSAIKIDEIVIAANTYISLRSYSAFEAMVLLWSSVKYIQTADLYELYLLQEV